MTRHLCPKHIYDLFNSEYQAASEALDIVQNSLEASSKECGEEIYYELDIIKTIRAALLQAEKAEGLVRALNNVNGILNYIAVQAVSGHSGFHKVAEMNAKNAIQKIDEALAAYREGK